MSHERHESYGSEFIFRTCVFVLVPLLLLVPCMTLPEQGIDTTGIEYPAVPRIQTRPPGPRNVIGIFRNAEQVFNTTPLCCCFRCYMASLSPSGSDPFIDPIEEVVEDEALEDSVLVVGRDASLTLATDSLIVLGSHFLPA